MEQENQIFRKKSLERIASPEELNDYLKVTNISAWAVLVSVIVLILGLLAWSALGRIETRLDATATAQNGVVTIIVPKVSENESLKSGMEIEIGAEYGAIDTVSVDPYGRNIATAKMQIPDGTYAVSIVTERISPLSFLF